MAEPIKWVATDSACRPGNLCMGGYSLQHSSVKDRSMTTVRVTHALTAHGKHGSVKDPSMNLKLGSNTFNHGKTNQAGGNRLRLLARQPVHGRRHFAA